MLGQLAALRLLCECADIALLVRRLRDLHAIIGSSGMTREFPVARAACEALKEFPVLGAATLDTIIETFEQSNLSEDDGFRESLLELLAGHAHPSLVPFFVRLLDSQVFVSDRSEPLFQLRAGAAKAILRQVCRFPEVRESMPVAPLCAAATHPDSLLAAPTLLTLGWLARWAAGELEAVHRHEETTPLRVALIYLGASAGRVPLDGGHLASVAPGHPLLALIPGEFAPRQMADWSTFAADWPAIAGWVQSLGTGDPVQKTARTACKVLFRFPDEP